MLDVLRKVKDAVVKLLEVITFVVTVVELQADGTPGPEKKAAAIAQLRELVDPATLPPFLGNNFDMIVGFLIDVVVGVLNREGFFKRS